jgi:hypothetical protein
LLGLTVIRAGADDAAQGDYGVTRRLLQLLRMLVPERMAELSGPDLPVLGHVFPELCVGRACEFILVDDDRLP